MQTDSLPYVLESLLFILTLTKDTRFKASWNLLLEEANKVGIRPDELLRRALTEYARKVKK